MRHQGVRRSFSPARRAGRGHLAASAPVGGSAVTQPVSSESRLTTCVERRSRGLRSLDAASPRSRPSRGTHCATCARSSTRIICTAISSWRAAQSPSLRWGTRSPPRRKQERILQNDPQNGRTSVTRKTEKAQWDQLTAGPGVEALLAEHESAYGTKRTYRICPLSGAKRTSASDCLPITIYEYTAFCNGPGDVKYPRVIVTPPSSRFCPWSAPRPPHYAVRRNGEPI